MTNLYFEELQIGIRSVAGPYLLSKEEIIRFAKQYDPIPRHIDEELAAQSVFGGLTASGSQYVCDLHPALGSASTALPGPDGIGLG